MEDSPAHREDRTVDELLESMVRDSLGSDSPTPQSLCIAGLEVLLRLTAARTLLDGKTVRGETEEIDTEAMEVLFLLTPEDTP